MSKLTAGQAILFYIKHAVRGGTYASTQGIQYTLGSCGYAKSTINRAIRMLESKGLVEVRQTEGSIYRDVWLARDENRERADVACKGGTKYYHADAKPMYAPWLARQTRSLYPQQARAVDKVHASIRKLSSIRAS